MVTTITRAKTGRTEIIQDESPKEFAARRRAIEELRRKKSTKKLEVIGGEPVIISVEEPERFNVSLDIGDGRQRILTNVTEADIRKETARTERSLNRQAQIKEQERVAKAQRAAESRLKSRLFITDLPSSRIITEQIAEAKPSPQLPRQKYVDLPFNLVQAPAAKTRRYEIEGNKVIEVPTQVTREDIRRVNRLLKSKSVAESEKKNPELLALKISNARITQERKKEEGVKRAIVKFQRLEDFNREQNKLIDKIFDVGDKIQAQIKGRAGLEATPTIKKGSFNDKFRRDVTKKLNQFFNPITVGVNIGGALSGVGELTRSGAVDLKKAPEATIKLIKKIPEIRVEDVKKAVKFVKKNLNPKTPEGLSNLLILAIILRPDKLAVKGTSNLTKVLKNPKIKEAIGKVTKKTLDKVDDFIDDVARTNKGLFKSKVGGAGKGTIGRKGFRKKGVPLSKKGGLGPQKSGAGVGRAARAERKATRTAEKLKKQVRNLEISQSLGKKGKTNLAKKTEKILNQQYTRVNQGNQFSLQLKKTRGNIRRPPKISQEKILLKQPLSRTKRERKILKKGFIELEKEIKSVGTSTPRGNIDARTKAALERVKKAKTERETAEKITKFFENLDKPVNIPKTPNVKVKKTNVGGLNKEKLETFGVKLELLKIKKTPQIPKKTNINLVDIGRKEFNLPKLKLSELSKSKKKFTEKELLERLIKGIKKGDARPEALFNDLVTIETQKTKILDRNLLSKEKLSRLLEERKAQILIKSLGEKAIKVNEITTRGIIRGGIITGESTQTLTPLPKFEITLPSLKLEEKAVQASQFIQIPNLKSTVKTSIALKELPKFTISKNQIQKQQPKTITVNKEITSSQIIPITKQQILQESIKEKSKRKTKIPSFLQQQPVKREEIIKIIEKLPKYIPSKIPREKPIREKPPGQPPKKILFFPKKDLLKPKLSLKKQLSKKVYYFTPTIVRPKTRSQEQLFSVIKKKRLKFFTGAELR